MPFSVHQRKRLACEKGILDNYFPIDRLRWTNPTAADGKPAEVEVDVFTVTNKKYSLTVIIPEDFPNSCPTLIVSQPSYLLKKKDGSLVGGNEHSWGSFNGFTKICHHRAERWTSDLTLYQVFMKGLIWLEAYEAHLRTGKPMDSFLREM